MRSLSCFLFALVSIVAAAPARAQAGSSQVTSSTPNKKDLQVIGGIPSTLAASPWQVALMDVDRPIVSGPFCGGSLIADRWVLTAAHCFYDIEKCQARFTAGRIWVLYGTTNLAVNAPKLAGVQKIHLPTQSFDCKTKSADIALLELSEVIGNLARMQLPTQQQGSALELAPPVRLNASGWGYTSESGAISQTLMEVSVPLVRTEQCKQLLEPTISIPPNTLCAGEYGKDTCRGDSGGPLFRRTAGSASGAVQFGVTSFGSGCGRPDRPGVYTRVAAHTDWIRKTMAAPTCTPALVAAGKC